VKKANIRPRREDHPKRERPENFSLNRKRTGYDERLALNATEGHLQKNVMSGEPHK